MAKRNGKRYFGNVRRLPSGRYQARYSGPDGQSYAAKKPNGKPLTFDTQGDAEAWLALRHSEILRGAWLPTSEPEAAPILFHVYATTWLAGRDIEDTTTDHYGQLLRDHVLPTFGAAPITSIAPTAVREWHAALKDKTGPTQRAHAYGLLRTIMNTAVADEMIPANPCRVRGAGQSKRVKKIRPATLPELETLVMALPARYRLMALFAAWCALRFGELAELRRSDIDVKNKVLHIRRGVVRTKTKGRVVKGPKSDAGKRSVNIPPHLVPLVKAHLRDHVTVDRDALLFPSTGDPTAQLAPSTLYRVYYPAREAAGRSDLRFHDLRHTGAVLAAATGATLAELMARLGHSTAGAALRYQHAAEDRDKAIAKALSKLAGGAITPITRATEKTTKKRKKSTA